jgi:hypothetical protein
MRFGGEAMKKIIPVVLIAASVAACVGPMVPIKTVETAGIAPFEKAALIKIVDAAATAKKTPLSKMSGYSCKNKAWDADPTEEAATLQLKIAAAQQGATAISAPMCKREGFSVVTNCWQSVTCEADAFR